MTDTQAQPTPTSVPWQVNGCRYKWRNADRDEVLDSHSVGPDGDPVCLVFFGPPRLQAEQFAIAKFIAAAPATASERDRLKSINAELVGALRIFQAFIKDEPIWNALITEPDDTLGGRINTALSKVAP